jgi:hypothetical protein
VKYEELGKGIVKRREQRILGLFIDGTGLDRATRRINRKVDMANLLRGVTSGLPPAVARYYTLIPYEDDSRQRAFLDAVARAGMQVIVKRLPPKGVTRQVSVDVEMAADIVAFAMGHSKFSNLSEYRTVDNSYGGSQEGSFGYGDQARGVGNGAGHSPGHNVGHSGIAHRSAGMFPAGSSQVRLRIKGAGGSEVSPQSPAASSAPAMTAEAPASSLIQGTGTSGALIEVPKASAAAQTRIVTVVCPGRDLAYSIALAKELGADTVTADFGQFNTGDVLKSAAKWIDLSDSETIWRDA